MLSKNHELRKTFLTIFDSMKSVLKDRYIVYIKENTPKKPFSRKPW